MRGRQQQRVTGRTALFFTVVVFLILVCGVGLALLIVALVKGADVIFRAGQPWVGTAIILAGAVSLLMGVIVSLISSYLTMRPVRKVTDAMDGLAKGHFDTRLELGGFNEARRISESFNKMAQELGSIETLRSDFVNNLSHEFKTPIVSVRGFAKLLAQPNLSAEEQNEYLDIIIRESDRLAAMADHVLTLSRLEHQSIAPPAQGFYLDEQLRRCILLLEQKLSRKQIEIETDLPPCRIISCEELLSQVWVNLLDNAVKFSKEGGQIRVLLRQGESCVEVAVADDGCGIPPEALPHVFDRFWQADRARATEGSGVGLAVVKRILELCGGTIAVESLEGEGSSFIVTLPRRTE